MTDPFSSSGAKTPPKPFTVEEGRRQIRSFVLRQGRFTEAQQRAFETLWPRYGLDYEGKLRDYDATFGRQAPRVLEIAETVQFRYLIQHIGAGAVQLGEAQRLQVERIPASWRGLALRRGQQDQHERTTGRFTRVTLCWAASDDARGEPCRDGPGRS